MTALADAARRLDPCVNWFKLLHRTHGRVLWAFPLVLFAAYVVTVRWSAVIDGVKSVEFQRSANAPLAAETRRLDLSYEAIAKDPDAAVGKPVNWCVDSFDGEHGFVDSKQTLPVVWDTPSSDLKSFAGVHGYCVKTLAVVTGFKRDAVHLRLVETY